MCVFVFVFVFVLWMLYFLWMFFYDKIAKNKEEFNILIFSRSRIMNLHVSCISNIRWKDKIFETFLTHQSHESAYLR
jgi:uncharacterized membrane protein